MSHLVLIIAQGNTTKLGGSGYDLRKDISHGNGEVSAPTDFRIKRSETSGKLLVHAASVAGAARYEADLAEADPTAESSWHCGRCSRVALSSGGGHLASRFGVRRSTAVLT